MLNIGFIGFGEAASQISLGLSKNATVNIFAYDILINDPEKKPVLQERASQYNVTLCSSIADLMSQVEIVFSTVVASVAEKVANETAPYLKGTHIYVDLNAITPGMSERIAQIVGKPGAVYVDGAMVGSLKALKHKVPILISGEGVDILAEKIEPLGFNLSIVGEKPGIASGNKLIRSVFTKGLAALLIETLVYAKKLGYYDVVLESMIKTLKADPADLIGRLVSGTMLHSQRRIGELTGSKEMLEDAELESSMIKATLAVLKNVNCLDVDHSEISTDIESSIELLSLYKH